MTSDAVVLRVTYSPNLADAAVAVRLQHHPKIWQIDTNEYFRQKHQGEASWRIGELLARAAAVGRADGLSANHPLPANDRAVKRLRCTTNRHIWVEADFGVSCLCGIYASAPPDFGASDDSQ